MPLLQPEERIKRAHRCHPRVRRELSIAETARRYQDRCARTTELEEAKAASASAHREGRNCRHKCVSSRAMTAESSGIVRERMSAIIASGPTVSTASQPPLCRRAVCLLAVLTTREQSPQHHCWQAVTVPGQSAQRFSRAPHIIRVTGFERFRQTTICVVYLNPNNPKAISNASRPPCMFEAWFWRPHLSLQQTVLTQFARASYPPLADRDGDTRWSWRRARMLFRFADAPSCRIHWQAHGC